MAVFTDLQIKQWFETGDIPTQQQFFNLIDSKVNVLDLPALLGLTINVTPITGGTDQNIVFQKAGKVSQDNSFKYYDATKRLAFGTLAPIARVHMYADTNLDSTPLEQVYERPLGVFNTNTNWQRHSSYTNGIRVGFFGLAQQAVGQGTRWSWANTNNTAIPATEAMRLSQSKQLSIGNQILDGAVVDVFSKGALSTDLAIRVRNSANTQDDFVVTGTGQTKIGSNGALLSPSALCQMDSTTRGVLFPRMTTAQRNAIAAPAIGLFIFNTTTNELNMWNGAGWRRYNDLP
jgi:hypothetical protein